MNRAGHNEVDFFVGGEVEHTPAFSKKTLFVVGRQLLADIEKYAREHKTPHIYMAANHSFDLSGHANNNLGIEYWDETITSLLKSGFMVTLDYPAYQHEEVLTMIRAETWHSRNFVPLLSVRIPKVETSSQNLTVKIDDVDFNSTNPGVWCMHYKDLTDSNKFTGWAEYGSDVVIYNRAPVEAIVPAKINKSDKVVIPQEPMVSTVSPMDQTLGLDVTPTTALKIDETVQLAAKVITNPETAAAAYAEGATSDPLSSKPTAKKAVKK